MQGYKADFNEKQKLSEEKLRKSCITKMRTIMIGSLSDIEEGKDYEELRKSILDRWNNLIRALEDELKNYTIVYKGEFFTFKKEG